MQALLDSLLNLSLSLIDLFLALLALILPWAPLLAWIAFWLYAVNWVKLRQFLVQGGWVGLVLLGLMAVLIWGTIAPPDQGTHALLGLHVSNYVGKTVYVTGLIVIMLVCGSVQLSGALGNCCRFEEDEEAVAHAPAEHH